MINTKFKNLQWYKTSGLLVAMFAAYGANAQLSAERLKNDSIAAKYKTENAVYASYTQRLVISAEEGALVAKSYVTMEKLLISDLSPSISNRDNFSYSDFNALSDYSAFAKIPTSSDYKTIRCNNFGEGGSGDDVFYDDFREVEVYYTNLQKNSVTETRYSLEHTDLHLLPRCFMQAAIPIASVTYEVVAPKYVNLSFVLKNTDNITIKQTKEEKNNSIIYRFTATGVPAIKAYSHVPNIWSYSAPHIIPYITSYRLTGAKKDSVILNTPEDLYRHESQYVRSLNLKTDAPLNNTVAALIKDDKTQAEKAAHIYNWVQKNIHYIAFEKGLEGFVPRPADTVFKRKYGDCKDMTSILVAMFRRAGLDAHYTWVGTSKVPYTFEETPLPLVSNHMICAVKIGGEWIFADGTESTLPFGKNRDDIQGKEAMIAIDATTYKVVTVPVEAADKNVTVDSTFIGITDYAIAGNVKLEYKGYQAWDTRMNMMFHKGEEREKAVKALTQRGSNKYTQAKYDYLPTGNDDRDVSINAAFKVDDYVQKVGKECYVNMNLRHNFENNRINDPERKVPYFFDYKQRANEVVVLDIPKGYKVSYLPKDAQGAANGLWSYKISYKADKEKVTLTKEYVLNTLSVDERQFAENNKMVDDLKKLYKETVVLTAIN
jgi:hypothetical protein